MVREATLRGLVEGGDTYVKEGDGYRLATMDDGGRRLYTPLSDGRYALLDFTATGLDGPEPSDEGQDVPPPDPLPINPIPGDTRVPAEHRVTFDVNQTLNDVVEEGIQAATPAWNWFKSCLFWFLVVVVGAGIIGGIFSMRAPG